MFADSGEILEDQIEKKRRRKEEERKSEKRVDKDESRKFWEREREGKVDLYVGICWLMGVREVWSNIIHQFRSVHVAVTFRPSE